MNVDCQGDVGVEPSGDKDHPSSQMLCRECGICCDGTFFDFAPIAPVDGVVQIKNSGITTICDEGTKFTLPCAKFDQVCTIYHLRRPEVCGLFLCKLIHMHDKGEISFEKGLEIIRETKAHKKEVEAIYSAAGVADGAKLRQRHGSLLRSQAEFPTDERGVLIAAYDAFERRILRDFSKARPIEEVRRPHCSPLDRRGGEDIISIL